MAWRLRWAGEKRTSRFFELAEVEATAEIAPLTHCMPAGTAPISWTAPDPHRDQVLVELQVIAPSVQEPELEELSVDAAVVAAAAAAVVSAGEEASVAVAVVAASVVAASVAAAVVAAAVAEAVAVTNPMQPGMSWKRYRC